MPKRKRQPLRKKLLRKISNLPQLILQEGVYLSI
jgi:hypothetical protein